MNTEVNNVRKSLDQLVESLAAGDPNASERVFDEIGDAHEGIRKFTALCHALANRSGWWDEYNAMPVQYRKYFISTKLMLSVSEIIEGHEGHRKNQMDDHLPHRKMLEVEIADAMIRLGDLAGALDLDVAGAIIEKLAYNQQRPDHKPENRALPGGKSV